MAKWKYCLSWVLFGDKGFPGKNVLGVISSRYLTSRLTLWLQAFARSTFVFRCGNGFVICRDFSHVVWLYTFRVLNCLLFLRDLLQHGLPSTFNDSKGLSKTAVDRKANTTKRNFNLIFYETRLEISSWPGQYFSKKKKPTLLAEWTSAKREMMFLLKFDSPRTGEVLNFPRTKSFDPSSLRLFNWELNFHTEQCFMMQMTVCHLEIQRKGALNL